MAMSNISLHSAKVNRSVESNVIPFEDANAARAAAFITNKWRSQPGKYFCLEATDPGVKPSKGTFFSRDEFENVKDYIEENSHKNIWWCPHGFVRRRRRKEFAVKPRWLYADLDGVDPDNLIVPPTELYESSPGRYVGLWHMDKRVGFEINKRVNYACAEDKSGWMTTKFLRVPHTINRKEGRDNATVRMVRRTGPRYTMATLNDALGPWARISEDGMKLLRRKYNDGDDRSEHRAKIVNKLVGEGFNDDQIFELFGNDNPWGGDSEKKLRADIKRLRKSYKGPRKSESDPGRLIMKSMDQYRTRKTSWSWDRRLACGYVNLFTGEGGVGKSTLIAAIAAAVSKGRSLPGHRKVRCGHVIYLQYEDDPDGEFKLRLMAAGADLTRVHNIEGIKRDGKEVAFNIRDDLGKIDEAVQSIDGRTRLLVIDPLTDFLGVSSIDDVKARAELLPVRRWARKRGITVIIVSHMNKAAGRGLSTRQRGSGTMAIPSTRRHGCLGCINATRAMTTIAMASH